ncbi:MAG: transporter, family, hexuronate transporter [Bryobacterales bacterium]|nr:transporter, family, hexuronate transporter [Bryobacterales bacterium]
MISLAFFATVINYLDRQTLSVAAPVLREQFHMSNVTYSRVVFGFLLAYTIMNGVSGPLIVRLGTKLGYALCIAWWSTASILHAFARGAFSLGFFRFLLGAGEAGNWPAAIRIVAEWFPESERARASGIFNSGSAVGAILAPPVVAFILVRFGWQYAFVLTGVLGFIWLLFWWPTYQTPPEAEDEVKAPVPSAWSLFRTRFVWSFTVAKIFLDPVWYFYIFWFPEYLKNARHFDMAAIGAYAWIPFLVAGSGNIFGGMVSGYLVKRGMPVVKARKTSVTLFALLMMAAIPAVLAPSAGMSIAFVSVAMTGYTGALASMLALPADVFPKNSVASVYGLASMGSGFGGMVFTLITGWVVDHYSYTPVFIGFGLIPLICAAVLWTLTKVSYD